MFGEKVLNILKTFSVIRMDPEEIHPNGAQCAAQYINIVVNKSAGEREQYVYGVACYLPEIKMFLHSMAEAVAAAGGARVAAQQDRCQAQL